MSVLNHLQITSDEGEAMPNPYVWFDNLSSLRSEVTAFWAPMFDWDRNEIGPMALLTDGENAPFPRGHDRFEGLSRSVSQTDVDDIADAGRREKEVGAKVIAEHAPETAVDVTIIKEAGASDMALWKRKAGM
ncbi:hypothetical protein [Roseibium sediminicola]|uniref:Uncharacterized protein n=1 Tax=Roseibium sediminicola TaxID=2933272 RepID=A0ABT0GZT6_9HYPH|nr:hypothetical protein [Roseibium sp. CAU 1639]MCK7614941.1 hypothetical protein [Roseibium sp. CAU 1639]